MKKKLIKIIALLLSLIGIFCFFQPVQAQTLSLGGYPSDPCDVDSDYSFHIEDYQPYLYNCDDCLSILGCVNRPTGNLCPTYEGYDLLDNSAYWTIHEGFYYGNQTPEPMWCPLEEWQEEYFTFFDHNLNNGPGTYEIVTNCYYYNYDTNDLKQCHISAGTVEIVSSENPPIYTPPEPVAPPDPINGECGTANGGHFSTPPEVSTLCSSESYVIIPSYVETPAGWTWICGGYDGGTQAYCSADYYYDLDPVITDVIDFDFDDFEYDFEEGNVSKNWLIDVFKFLFLPREETLQKFFTTFDNFKQKIPLGYIYLIRDKFKEVSLESTDEFALDLNLLGEDYEVFSVTSLKQEIGESTFNIFYDTMKALIWIMFALYLIVKVQKLFNSD